MSHNNSVALQVSHFVLWGPYLGRIEGSAEAEISQPRSEWIQSTGWLLALFTAAACWQSEILLQTGGFQDFYSIIVKGNFSWVKPEIFELCQQQLLTYFPVKYLMCYVGVTLSFFLIHLS